MNYHEPVIKSKSFQVLLEAAVVCLHYPFTQLSMPLRTITGDSHPEAKSEAEPGDAETNEKCIERVPVLVEREVGQYSRLKTGQDSGNFSETGSYGGSGVECSEIGVD